MAEAAVMDAPTTGFEPPPPAPKLTPNPKGGRPPGYKPFNNELTPEDFFVLLNDIDDADWPKSLCYVWRRDPFTDNTNGGREPKYVDVINRAVSEKDIKEEHGSGTYKLQLNTNDKYIAHTILSLEDPKYPPHVPPGDWFNNPRNKKWSTWKPLVEKWWQDKLKILAGPVATTEPQNGAALSELTRLISQLANNGKNSENDKLSSTLVAWALQQTADEKKADREADSPGKLAELIRAVKELSPPAPAASQDNTFVTFLLDEVKSMRETTNRLMERMLDMKTKSEAQPDPLHQVETMAKLITTVSGIVQPAAPKEWYQDLAETLGPKVVDLTGQLIAMNQMRRPPVPQPQQLNRPNPQVVQPSYPSPQPAAALQPQDTPQPIPPEVPQESEMDTMQRSLLINIANLAAQAMNLSMTGEQFADQVCYKFGGAAYDQFVSTVAQTDLLPKFRTIPEAWAVLQPFEGDLPNFIESFYAFSNEDEEEETKSISLPEPVVEIVKPVRKPKKTK